MNKVDWVWEAIGKGESMANSKKHACPKVAGTVLLQVIIVTRNFRNNIVTSLDF